MAIRARVESHRIIGEVTQNHAKQFDLCAVINPSSRGGTVYTIWPALLEKLQARYGKIHYAFSDSEMDFRKLVRQFAALSPVIAICGGDTSLTIAAQELVRENFDGELMFLPAGTHNDLIADIQIKNLNLTPHCELIVLRGESRDAETQLAFIGQANWGMGAIVNYRVKRWLSRFPILRGVTGFLGLVAIIVSHLQKKDIVSAKITTDAEMIEGEFSIVLIGQIYHWSGGLKFCPSALGEKGQLHLVAISRKGLWSFLKMVMSAKTGRHLQRSEVKVFQTRTAMLEFKNRVMTQIDGDVMQDASGAVLRFDQFQCSKIQTKFELTAMN